MHQDLKHYGAVDIMNTALAVAESIAAIFCIGVLIVVALGWPY